LLEWKGIVKSLLSFIHQRLLFPAPGAGLKYFLLPPVSSEAILQPPTHGGKARRTNVFTGRLKISNYDRGEYAACTTQEIVIAFFYMKSYVIDELRREDYNKIKIYADEKLGPSGVSGIYWIPLVPDILSDIQTAHEQCRPFYFAVDLEPHQIACELLVRTKSRVRCSCINYATEKQRNWLIRFIDGIFDKLEIKT